MGVTKCAAHVRHGTARDGVMPVHSSVKRRCAAAAVHAVHGRARTTVFAQIPCTRRSRGPHDLAISLRTGKVAHVYCQLFLFAVHTLHMYIFCVTESCCCRWQRRRSACGSWRPAELARGPCCRCVAAAIHAWCWRRNCVEIAGIRYIATDLHTQCAPLSEAHCCACAAGLNWFRSCFSVVARMD